MSTSRITILFAMAIALGLILSKYPRSSRHQDVPTAAPKPVASSTQTSKHLGHPPAASSITTDNSLDDWPLPPADALGSELILQYPDSVSAAEASERLRQAGFTILAQSSALNALRVRVTNSDEHRRLAELAGDTAQPGYNFTVSLPPLPDDSAQTSPGIPFGPNATRWMGADNNTSLGHGVTIAIIDSGVSLHPNIQHALIGEIDLVNDPARYGHGTAVASLIASQNPDAPGIAPSTQILSIRALNHEGVTDAFTLAEAIVIATDSGAKIINLSLGSHGDAPILRQAVSYADSHDKIIVASTGNDGIQHLSYPAAYPEVIAVGAIDASGQRAGFSNFGDGIDIAAPGVGVYAAWDLDGLVSFSGTSASAPLISGALAGLLSQNPNLTSAQAREIMLATANDSGAPGQDPHTGAGSADLFRMLNYQTPGIKDIAVADHYIPSTNFRDDLISMFITVQNRGTAWSNGSQLTVHYEGRTQQFPIESLAPGQTTFREILINPQPILQGSGTIIHSQISSGPAEDNNPHNDAKRSFLALPTP